MSRCTGLLRATLLSASLLAASLLGASGCARWTPEVSDQNPLPVPRMSPDTVVLEVIFLPIGQQQIDLEQELWSMADEQHFPVELRRRLHRNGFRAGLLGAQLPEAVRTLLNSQPDVVQSLSEADSGHPTADLSHRPQRRQLRAGRRAQILAGSKTYESLAVLYRDDDGQVRGDTYEQAQCLFGLISNPLGDGRAKLQITPEVQHGLPRQGWVGHEGAFRWDAQRQKRVFETLRMEVTLAPGETLVLTSTDESIGLGRRFFVLDQGERSSRRLLLVRLAQTQFDDLFAPERVVSPLATPAP